ncbi:MAG: DNA adenine methylase [bacterium]
MNYSLRNNFNILDIVFLKLYIKLRFKTMQRYYSPLRYPGGKASLLNFLRSVINYNSPIDTYIEPFAGGAGAALGLLINGSINKIIINDADEFIYKFWDSILRNKEKFIRKVENTPVNVKEYYKQKEILTNPKKRNSSSNLAIGFSTFYLNRCNRSGILRSGPIGGYNQNGKWKIDARFNKTDLIKRIELINKFRNNIEVYNCDALDFLNEILPNLNIDLKKTLIYLDPPYYNQGPELYRKFYNNGQHAELRDFLLNVIKTKWVLSYDDVPQINELYNGIRINGYSKSHFANKAKIGKELIIFSDNCVLPESYEYK